MSSQKGCSPYADDATAWAQNPQKEVANAKVQEAVDNIAQWSDTRKTDLSLENCETGFFSTDSGEANWSPTIYIAGTPLRRNPNPRFLGVTLDRLLTFGPPLEATTSKMNQRLRMIRALSHREWGRRKRYLRTVYMLAIRSLALLRPRPANLARPFQHG